MIDRNHPAVEAAWRALTLTQGAADGVPLVLAFPTALTSALPHLESATEDNLARLRDTPAGRALMAEGWEEGAGDMRDHQENPHRWPTVSNPYRT